MYWIRRALRIFSIPTAAAKPLARAYSPRSVYESGTWGFAPG
jgi:hypothetical protein